MARVLLVEDDPAQREIRQLLLEAAGHEVAAAASLEEAVDRSPGCEVMVLDLIPNSSELLSAVAPEMRVIVLSGREVAPDSLRADTVLRKPCSSRQLLAAIAQLCMFLLAWTAGAATFEVAKPTEMIAELDMRAPGTDWGNPEKPAVLATVLIDGKEQQNVMLYSGAERFTYRIFLGMLGTGKHHLEIKGAGAELLESRFREDSSDVLAHAPVLHARPNTIGKFTDIPLITYCERLYESGLPMLQYSVIYSNEDAGTSTRALMARWGRTTDIEWVYKVFLNADGSAHHATIQAAAHKEITFEGKLEGSHPLLLTATDNNNVAFDRTSEVRYQIPPVLVDLSEHSREQVMDDHPFTYRIMSKELGREGKLRPFDTVQGQNVSDPRNYVFIEANVKNYDSAIGIVIEIEDDNRWFTAHLGRTDYAISRDGWVRVAVELPPGTKAEQIFQMGCECLVAEKKVSGMCDLLAVSKVFMLDAQYKPGPVIWSSQRAQRMQSGDLYIFPFE